LDTTAGSAAHAATPALTAPDLTTPNLTTPEATVLPGQWGNKFAGRFSEGDLVITDNSYQSDKIAINIEKVQQDAVTYYIADIYLSDIEYFRTAFAGGSYARNGR
jgi:hypothetical protein